MTSSVRFSEVDEFLAELAGDADDVARRIVRVSLRFTPSKLMPSARNVEMVAGYELTGGAGVVRMERWLGDFWVEPGARDVWVEPGDRDVLDRADAMQARIVAAVNDLGLECRPGVFEKALPLAGERRRPR